MDKMAMEMKKGIGAIAGEILKCEPGEAMKGMALR